MRLCHNFKLCDLCSLLQGHGGQLCSYSTQSLLQSSGGGGGGGGSVGGTTGSLVVIIGGVCGALIVLSAAAFGSFCYLHRKHRSLVRKFSARPARLEEEEGKQSSSARGHMSLTLSPLQAARLQDRIDYDDESGLPFPQASRAGMQVGNVKPCCSYMLVDFVFLLP